jgi:DNA-binding MarR family transcriptional regulator
MTQNTSFTQLINELYQQIRSFTYNQAKEQNLTPVKWQVLNYLEQNNNTLTQYQLSKLMNRDLGQLTRLLNQLEAEQLIRKATDKKDKRMRHISLTNKAKEKISPIKVSINKFYDNLKENLLNDEYDQLVELLTKAKDKIKIS